MNIQELKHMMNHVPDTKMRHNVPFNKPMPGSSHDKKHEVAKKMTHEGKVALKKPRMLSESEQKEKTKHWPKGPAQAVTSHEKHEHQNRVGRSYDD